MIPRKAQKNINLDLAFQGWNRHPSVQNHNDFKTIFLFDSDPWIREIESWLEFIINDKSFFCPEVLREVNSFSMGIQLVDDLRMKNLNSKWRNTEKTTDVISFSVLDNDFQLPCCEDVELGDIFVSVPTAKRQAIDHNHDLEMELRWLVSHGFLHLLGWDHSDFDTLKQMLDAQEQLLKNNVNVQNMFS
tara:strand:+ start:112 stop:678 length:567 start_codon:yes stop_codon:yes gene_type:complete